MRWAKTRRMRKWISILKGDLIWISNCNICRESPYLSAHPTSSGKDCELTISIRTSRKNGLVHTLVVPLFRPYLCLCSLFYFCPLSIIRPAFRSYLSIHLSCYAFIVDHLLLRSTSRQRRYCRINVDTEI